MRLWRLRFRLVLTIVGVLVAFAAVMSLSLAFALSGTGSVSSQTCNTTLAQAVGAGSDVITVADMADCDPLDWIVINQGGATEECQQIESVAAGAPILYLYGALDNAHPLRYFDGCEPQDDVSLVGGNARCVPIQRIHRRRR